MSSDGYGGVLDAAARIGFRKARKIPRYVQNVLSRLQEITPNMFECGLILSAEAS